MTPRGEKTLIVLAYFIVLLLCAILNALDKSIGTSIACCGFAIAAGCFTCVYLVWPLRK